MLTIHTYQTTELNLLKPRNDRGIQKWRVKKGILWLATYQLSIDNV